MPLLVVGVLPAHVKRITKDDAATSPPRLVRVRIVERWAEIPSHPGLRYPTTRTPPFSPVRGNPVAVLDGQRRTPRPTGHGGKPPRN
ncbi:hypothetical protein R1flu_001926 [Riccia fluitans]|uniref:Uncharacterized protein n=1 Tax=Riccia fluitans TaxID=41844 RepID=A0ABD1Y528_9MARC